MNKSVENGQQVHARKKFTETFERYESLETCLKRFFNEALHGSDSVCKGSNPFTIAKTKKAEITKISAFFLMPFIPLIFNFFVLEGFIYKCTGDGSLCT